MATQATWSEGDFVSLRKLCRLLGHTPEYVKDLAGHAGRHYRPYRLERPLKFGGHHYRDIDHPVGRLKDLQSRIHQRILRQVALPDHVHGGVKGKSPLKNARMHCAAKYVVGLDIRKFFPSVSHRQVFAVWRSLGFSPSLARILTKLTTFKGHLPQGAPTSTALANLVLLTVDDQIIEQAKLSSTVYTRFVDDIALSGNYPQQFIPMAILTIQRKGMRVHKGSKMTITSRGNRQTVTGYAVNRASPTKTRVKRDRIRAAINQLVEISDAELHAREIRSILGRIQDIRYTNPGAANRLNSHLQRVK